MQKLRIRNLLYTVYGRTVLSAHLIEKEMSLHIALWHFLKHGRNKGSFYEKYEELSKKPFGRRIIIGIKEGAIPDDWTETLENYRKLRNYLVHDISDFIVNSFLTGKEPSSIMSKLNNISDNFEGFHKEIRKHVAFLSDLAGLSEKDINKSVMRLVSDISKTKKLPKPKRGGKNVAPKLPSSLISQRLIRNSQLQ